MTTRYSARITLWVLSVAWLCSGHTARAQAPDPGPGHEQVIEPQIDRRDINTPAIDTENFEITGFGGVLNVEDFGSHAVYGVRAAYHVTEDFFLEASFGLSQVSDSSFRDFAITVFEEEDENLSYYNLSLGFNVLPGEVFVWRSHAWTSAIYLLGGAGNTRFNDEDFFTVNLGFGVRILPTDYLSVRIDGRDYIWNSDLLGSDKTTNNLELTGNLGFYF